MDVIKAINLGDYNMLVMLGITGLNLAPLINAMGDQEPSSPFIGYGTKEHIRSSKEGTHTEMYLQVGS